MSDQDDQGRLPRDNSAQAQQGARQQQHGQQPQGGNERNSGGGGGGHRYGRRRSGQTHSPNEARRQDSNVNASVNMTELRDLVELIATYGFTDFELEREGFRVRLRREQTSQTAAAPTQGVTSPMTAPFAQAASSSQPSSPTAPPSSAPAPESSATKTATENTTASAEVSDADLQMIPSPIVGTFYRAPSPTAEPFIKVGSVVEPDTVVCIIEAMKLMNEILAETSGTIEKIYVENGQPVEYGQRLFGVRK